MTVYPLLSCGRREPCLNGHAHVCDSLRLIGIDCDGGMAEYVKVPADKVLELSQTLSFKHRAFIEPLSVGVHAVRRSGYKPGDRAVVFGAGPPEVDLLEVEFKELTMIGIRVYERRDFETATRILQSGSIDFDLILSEAPPEQVPEVFQQLL